MKRSIETQIKLNTIIVYLVILALFLSMLGYIYSFRDNLDEQKKNIERYNAELGAAEKLIQEVNEAQSEVNLYVATKDPSHHQKFTTNLVLIQQSIDSLATKSVNDSNKETLGKINTLLTQKGKIVTSLNDLLIQKDLLENVNDYLRKYKNGRLGSLLSNKEVQVKDTLITKAGPKKGFWKKVGDLFSSSKIAQDTIKVKSEKTEVSKTHKKGTKTDDLSKIRRFVQQASSDYISQLVGIENKVNDLVMSDQEISFKISRLLIDYYSQIIHARFNEIHNSDMLIQKNNNYTLIGGLIALIPIMFSLITILRNVNKGKRARLALENANEKIRQVMESRHQLLLSVSHDIKTPLNSIMGALENNDESASALIGTSKSYSMLNSGKHILALLNNLLDFSSIEQGKLTLQYSPFHLQELCLEIADMFAPLCNKKNLSFEYNFEFNKELIANTDNLKLKQIIINILSNAVKYTVKGKIEFNVAYKENNLLIRIADTGVGVPKNQLDKIFAPFVRVQENNSIAEGSGFGMYVVKGLVDMFAGSIKAESKVGKGTTFTVRLPIETQTAPLASLKAKHVLLIDDDPALLLALKSIIQQLGHEVDTILTMEELNQKIGIINKYDLIFTDMEMGTSSGLNSLETVRKFNKEVPVVLMTARSEISEEQVKLMGFTACLPKPISRDMLSIFLGETEYKNTSEDNQSKNSGFELPFKSLREMVGKDEDTLREILSEFTKNAQKDLAKLKESVETKAFEKAQRKCHKLLSMFMQTDPENEAIPLLKKMDSSRDPEKQAYSGWTEDVKKIVKACEGLLERIGKYLA